MISDDQSWSPSRLITSPEVVGRRPAFAINNLIFLRALQLARDAGLEFFFTSKPTAESSAITGMKSSGIVSSIGTPMVSDALVLRLYGTRAIPVLHSPAACSSLPTSSKRQRGSALPSMADLTREDAAGQSFIRTEAEPCILRRCSCNCFPTSKATSKCSRDRSKLGTLRSDCDWSAPSGTKCFRRSAFSRSRIPHSGIASSVTKSARGCCSQEKFPSSTRSKTTGFRKT